jgi:hypothetical protein
MAEPRFTEAGQALQTWLELFVCAVGRAAAQGISSSCVDEDPANMGAMSIAMHVDLVR